MNKDVDTRTFNEKLNDQNDLPKIINVGKPRKTNKSSIARVIIAHPLEYDALMKSVPYGRLITINNIKDYLARKYNTDYACPVSSRNFIILVSYAANERNFEITPYWRTLNKDGQLNEKYAGGIELLKEFICKEGHNVIQKGNKYFVENYSDKLFSLI